MSSLLRPRTEEFGGKLPVVVRAHQYLISLPNPNFLSALLHPLHSLHLPSHDNLPKRITVTLSNYCPVPSSALRPQHWGSSHNSRSSFFGARDQRFITVRILPWFYTTEHFRSCSTSVLLFYELI